MATTGIRAVASVHAKDGDEFVKAAKKFIEESRKEEGVLFFELFRDFENPQPDRLTFIEHYKDAEALQAHFASDHFQEFVALDLAIETVVKTYVTVGI